MKDVEFEACSYPLRAKLPILCASYAAALTTAYNFVELNSLHQSLNSYYVSVTGITSDSKRHKT